MLDRLREKEIIANLKQKRAEAWVALVDAYHLKLNQRIGIFFTSSSTANRITQEVFIYAATKTDKLKPNDSLWCFLWEIASDHIKKEYKKDIYQDKVANAIKKIFPDKRKIASFRPLDQANSMPANELAQVIRFTISTLDSKQQSILLGKFLETMTTRHISKEVGLHSEELRKFQDITVKNFYLQFKNITNIDIIPTYSQNESLDVLTILCKPLKTNNIQQQSLDSNTFLDISLQEFNKKTRRKYFDIPLEKTTKISILAILIVVFTATLVFMINKSNKRESQHLDILKREQTTVKKNPIVKNLDNNKSQSFQPKQKKSPLEKEEIQISLNRISKLAQNNDIAGLIRLLDSDKMIDKMIAAGFLATIGDSSAIAPLTRESQKWTGKKDNNVFDVAIHKINERIKSSDYGEGSKEKANLKREDNTAATLKGTIKDSHGNGIALAKVRIYSYHQDKENNKQSDYTLETTASSDKDGIFNTSKSIFEMKNKNLILIATHPSYGFYYQKIAPQKSHNISIKLLASSELVCDIVNEYDEPLEDATVSLQITYHGEILSSKLLSTIGVNGYIDENGTLAVSNLPNNCQLKIKIQCTGYIDQEITEDISQTLKHIRVILKENNKIECYLIDAYGTEIQGFIKINNSEIIKSDQYGHIEIPIDDNEKTSGFAYDTNKKIGAAFTIYNNDVMKSRGVEIILKEGIKLSGRVVDGNGDIISDAKFRILFIDEDGEIITSPWNLWLSDYKKLDGSFILEGIPEGLSLELYIEDSTASKSVVIQSTKTDEPYDLGNIELKTY